MLVSLINIFLQVPPYFNSTADAITIVTGVISIITTIIAIGIYIKNRRLRGWSAQLRKPQSEFAGITSIFRSMEKNDSYYYQRTATRQCYYIAEYWS